jgi:hypothetical protein
MALQLNLETQPTSEQKNLILVPFDRFQRGPLLPISVPIGRPTGCFKLACAGFAGQRFRLILR